MIEAKFNCPECGKEVSTFVGELYEQHRKEFYRCGGCRTDFVTVHKVAITTDIFKIEPIVHNN